MEETRQLRTQLDLMQAALDHINQGFSAFDADLRLVAWNRGLWEMLDFPQELACRGTHLEAFLRVNAERGEYGPGDIEGKIRRRLERAKLFEPHYFERIRPNGQVIAVSGTGPIGPDGETVGPGDIAAQTRRCWEISLQALVEPAREGCFKSGDHRLDADCRRDCKCQGDQRQLQQLAQGAHFGTGPFQKWSTTMMLRQCQQAVQQSRQEQAGTDQATCRGEEYQPELLRK